MHETSRVRDATDGTDRVLEGRMCPAASTAICVPEMAITRRGRPFVRTFALMLAVGTAAGVIAAGASAGGLPGLEKFEPDERGTRMASHAVVHAPDLPARSGWVDARIKISDHHLDSCGRRVDDVVLRGYALSGFVREAPATGVITGAVVGNAEVFASRAMLGRYTARTFGSVALACLRKRAELRLGGRLRSVSVSQMAFPRVASSQRAFRITFYPGNARELWEEDAILIARGRTLAFIGVAPPAAARNRATTLRYVRIIAARMSSS